MLRPRSGVVKKPNNTGIISTKDSIRRFVKYRAVGCKNGVQPFAHEFFFISRTFHSPPVPIGYQGDQWTKVKWFFYCELLPSAMTGKHLGLCFIITIRGWFDLHCGSIQVVSVLKTLFQTLWSGCSILFKRWHFTWECKGHHQSWGYEPSRIGCEQWSRRSSRSKRRE